MRFDGLDTLEGRHLVLSYLAVFLIQGGYLFYLLGAWRREKRDDSQKATRSA